MIEERYIDNIKIINIFPDYTPEEQEKANQLFLQKLYDIFFGNEKNNNKLDTKR